VAEIEWVILADNAEVVGNRLFLMGGGWDKLTPNTPAFVHFLAVAVSIQVEWDDVVQEREHRIDITHAPVGAARKLLVTAMAKPMLTPQMREGEKQRAQLAVKIALQFDAPGTHDIEVSLNGATTKTVRFHVNPVAAPLPEQVTKPELKPAKARRSRKPRS